MAKIVNYAVFTCIIFMIIHFKYKMSLKCTNSLVSIYLCVWKIDGAEIISRNGKDQKRHHGMTEQLTADNTVSCI